jgi:hypothetical protein
VTPLSLIFLFFKGRHADVIIRFMYSSACVTPDEICTISQIIMTFVVCIMPIDSPFCTSYFLRREQTSKVPEILTMFNLGFYIVTMVVCV